jgi:hypothetical protein
VNSGDNLGGMTIGMPYILQLTSKTIVYSSLKPDKFISVDWSLVWTFVIPNYKRSLVMTGIDHQPSQSPLFPQTRNNSLDTVKSSMNR